MVVAVDSGSSTAGAFDSEKLGGGKGLHTAVESWKTLNYVKIMCENNKRNTNDSMISLPLNKRTYLLLSLHFKLALRSFSPTNVLNHDHKDDKKR